MSTTSEPPDLSELADIELIREIREATGLSMKAIRHLLTTDDGLDDLCDTILAKLAIKQSAGTDGLPETNCAY